MARPIEVRLSLSPALFRGLMAWALLFALASELATETITLATYYPAPSGIYTQMITTGNTFLARDGGGVGIGTTAPGLDKLLVNGDAAVTGAAKVRRFFLNGYEVPSPPAVTTRLSWQTATVGYEPAKATYGGWSGCSYWYTQESCNHPNQADSCDGIPAGRSPCLDLADSGCAWGVRIGRTVTCKAEVPGRTGFVLTAE